MDFYKRAESKDLRWLLLIGAAAGTAALGFVPSGAWLAIAKDGDPAALLMAYALKQALTVLLLCAVPALWARLGHRMSYWSLVGLSAIAFGIGFWITKDARTALYTLLLVALPGVGLFALQKLLLNNFRTVLYESVIVLLALFGYVCLPDLIANGDAYLPFRTVIGAYERLAGEMQTVLASMGGTLPYGDLSALAEMAAEYRLNAEVFGVPVLMIPAMAAGLSNVLLSHLMNRRGGAELTQLPPFAQWRCSRTFVIAAAVFGIVSFFLRFTGWYGMEALAGAASILWRFPCALAGLCAIRRLSLRVHKGWIFAIACCIAAAIPMMSLPVLALLGMLSSMRKQTNVGEDGTKL